MLGDGDGSARASGRPDTEELHEGRVSARNGRLVRLRVHVNVVSPAINGDLAHLGTAGVGRPITEPIVHDIIFVQRVFRPPIDSDVIVTAAGSGLGLCEVRRDGSDLAGRLSRIESQADPGQEVPRIVPSRTEFGVDAVHGCLLYTS